MASGTRRGTEKQSSYKMARRGNAAGSGRILHREEK